MTKQETYIIFILNEIKKGNVERKTVFAKFVKKWHVSQRTFDRVWKVAQERHAELVQRVQKQKDAQYVDIESKIDKTSIIDKARRMEIASQIAEGILVDNDGNEPDFNARLKALDYLAKVEGDYAPVKNEHSGKDGQPIQVERVKTTLKL